MRKLFLLLALMATALLSFGAVPEDQFTFVSHQDGSLIGLATLSTHQTLEYSIDGISWNNMTTETTISLNNGVSLYIRGKLTDNNNASDLTRFSVSGAVEAKGNVNYIWDYEDLNAPLKEYCGCVLFGSTCPGLMDIKSITMPATTLANSCYRGMFYRNTSIISSPELPATTLVKNCYRYMYEGCEQLQSVPNLPATTLADSCYWGMFNECTSLASAPSLPATILAVACYDRMFRACTSLTAAPELPATTLANDCYNAMFWGCTNLTSAPELPASTMRSGCYASMFRETGLTTAPELPATTLALSCYAYMFQDCPNLITPPSLPATILAGRCYFQMFYGDSSLVTTPELPATVLAPNCYTNMFRECTSLESAPLLPALTLETRCYSGMFYGCTNLTSAPELPATTLANYCYASMFYGCDSLKIAPSLPSTTLATGCYDMMFKLCIGITAAPVLPATILVDACYYQMFNGCSNLQYVKCLATDISAENCTYGWVGSVASSGTFVKNEVMTAWTRGAAGIPSGWEIDSIQPYTINFDAKGGLIPTEGLMANTPARQASFVSQDQKNGYVIVNSGEKTFSQLRKDCPTREGHTFLGWYTAATGGIQVYDDAGIYVEGDNWDEDGRWIGTADLQLYAQWSVNSYTITWLQDDGSLIDKTTVPYGQIPTHVVPTKEPTAEFTYTFAGWAPEIVAVTDNATYIATYTATPIAEDIKNVTTTEKQATKTIRNGQLFIQQGDKLFNAQGARVE